MPKNVPAMKNNARPNPEYYGGKYAVEYDDNAMYGPGEFSPPPSDDEAGRVQHTYVGKQGNYEWGGDEPTRTPGKSGDPFAGKGGF